MTIFFDVDGTLLDVRERYFRSHLAGLESVKPILTKEEYWELKQNKTPEKEILARHYPSVDADRYETLRHPTLEEADFVAADTLLPGVKDLLKKLSSLYPLIIVTLRKHPDVLAEQLRALEIDSYFTHVLSSPSHTLHWETKAALMKPHAEIGDWIIGDTEADILAGKQLGLITCGVLSGIRTRALLEELSPDHLIASVADFPNVMRLHS